MHGFASLLALRTLQSHKVGRYFPLVIAVAGFLYPLTGGIVTSKNCIILMSVCNYSYLILKEMHTFLYKKTIILPEPQLF